jgi:hypothetical protein
MTDRQENKRSMYLAVRAVTDTFEPAWLGLPAFVQIYTRYKTELEDLAVMAEAQERATTGVTGDKQQAKEQAITLAIKVGSATFAYASVTENLTLQGLVNYTKSALDKSRDTVLIDKLKVIYEAGNDNVANLADYGITAADITAFETAITSYTEQVQNPRTAIAEGAAATDRLAEIFDTIDGILKKQMDKLMEVLKASDDEFYVKYRKARIIVDLKGGGPADTDPSLPTP